MRRPGEGDRKGFLGDATQTGGAGENRDHVTISSGKRAGLRGDCRLWSRGLGGLRRLGCGLVLRWGFLGEDGQALSIWNVEKLGDSLT